mmetsp:Transcript_17523/g.48738  ORF Transcript_17523/g.48738 Transcript_17523/m.48738 type:complete len:285 (-) Transcript_17523:108-962(-)
MALQEGPHALGVHKQDADVCAHFHLVDLSSPFPLEHKVTADGGQRVLLGLVLCEVPCHTCVLHHPVGLKRGDHILLRLPITGVHMIHTLCPCGLELDCSQCGAVHVHDLFMGFHELGCKVLRGEWSGQLLAHVHRTIHDVRCELCHQSMWGLKFVRLGPFQVRHCGVEAAPRFVGVFEVGKKILGSTHTHIHDGYSHHVIDEANKVPEPAALMTYALILVQQRAALLLHSADALVLLASHHGRDANLEVIIHQDLNVSHGLHPKPLRLYLSAKLYNAFDDLCNL